MTIPFLRPHFQRNDLEAILTQLVDATAVSTGTTETFENALADRCSVRHVRTTSSLTSACEAALLSCLGATGRVAGPAWVHPAWLKAAQRLQCEWVSLENSDPGSVDALVWSLLDSAPPTADAPIILDATFAREVSPLPAGVALAVFDFGWQSLTTTVQGAGVMWGQPDSRVADPPERSADDLERLSDVSAALGLAQLKRLVGLIEAQKRLAAFYAEASQQIEFWGGWPGADTPPGWIGVSFDAPAADLVAAYAQSDIEVRAWPTSSVMGTTSPPRQAYGKIRLPYYPTLQKEEAEQVARLTKRLIELYGVQAPAEARAAS